ncbi:MAG: hypothetical protein V3U88_09040 [Methylococcales bacterium]
MNYKLPVNNEKLLFDTLTHCRQYKKAWNIDNSINYIKERRDTPFDPELVNI